MHQLFAPWRLLFSSGIATALALSLYAGLAALSPQPRTIALIGIMGTGMLLPLGCVGLQRWLGRIRALDYVAAWSFIGTVIRGRQIKKPQE